ncbi:outer membrane beta-barrel protein [Acinetobacter sp. 187]|uniref:Outer membrane beta-barrel protein n=1 Tax=Acinetobacter lanii TaxID=2715163 RepID=A0A6G8S7E2_9GAMM|nr:OmpW family outer membrane protein [Acinetobacter lanii]NHC02839.1 outer membrane beta-barrel protein [Acinetobacter lanii]QIO10032.1 outer membrane beta-barrel protein [Acinetobacter lanii]
MLKQISLVVLLGMSASAMAGHWQAKVGASVVAPTSDSKVAGGALTVEADNEWAFTPAVEYFFNDHISTELLLATPINHDVLVEGKSAASLKHLPPTWTVKYNFKNKTDFTPYAGIGLIAFLPWDESTHGILKGTKLKVQEDIGFAGQVGVSYQPKAWNNWGAYVDVRYAQLDPKVDSSLVDKFDLDIDPLVYSFGLSYKF